MINLSATRQDFLAGAVAAAGLVSAGPHPLWLVEAVFPAVEQHDAPSPPVDLQHSDLPAAIVEQEPSLPPQQPLPPSAVLHSMPAAEHLQPSLVPPVLLVGVALAATMLPSLAGAVDEVALELFADLLPLPVLPVFELPALQPANTSMTNASNTTNLIFMGGLLFLPG
ncbi:MAG TPA: hypothetical protein VGX92_02665 [Pyrinomonadaceae bacterium]|nr:hypothetical protein [Pyrinomonadaceae bacterium]